VIIRTSGWKQVRVHESSVEDRADSIGVSVIVATRNYAARLPRVLGEIVSAEAPPGVGVEIIIVDNNSTDDTANVVKAATARDPRVRYLLQTQPGTCASRNLGIEEARGSLLLFTDHDVLVDRNWIRAHWAAFQDDAVQVAQGPILWEGGLPDVPEWMSLAALPYLYPREGTVFVDTLIACNIAVRRGVFEHYGHFSRELGPGKTGGGEDTEFASRLQSFGVKLHFVPHAMVHHEDIRERLTPRYFIWRGEMEGFSMETIHALVQWKPPRTFRLTCKLAKHRMKWCLAWLIGQRAHQGKCRVRIARNLGKWKATLRANRMKRLICSRPPSLTVFIISPMRGHVRQSIHSIPDIAQEVIVVNGCSSDEKIAGWPSEKVRYLDLPPVPGWENGDQALANRAMAQAHGDWNLLLRSGEVVGSDLRHRIPSLMKDARQSCYLLPVCPALPNPSARLPVSGRSSNLELRLFRNLPPFRYALAGGDAGSFPSPLQARARILSDAHIFTPGPVVVPQVRGCPLAPTLPTTGEDGAPKALPSEKAD